MEQASLRLMRGLKARGHSVKMLSLNPIGELGPLLEEAGIPYEGLPYLGKGGWRSSRVLKKKIEESQADALLMTGHNLLANLSLGGFCKGRRILALHYHHTGVKPPWQWKLIYRVARQYFNAITFPCDFIRHEAAALAPDIAGRSYTVGNPLDMPTLPTAEDKVKARALLDLDSDRPVVGNGGWLIARKRFDVFLRVAEQVLRENPKVIFVIAGDGPDGPALELLAQELGISASVRWLGWQRDMATFYKATDVVLFNSDWDAMGLTPLEAMSYGVPVVCSVLHGGLSEVINSDKSGHLFSTHDIKAMASSVLHLLKFPEEARVLGLAGRDRVEEVSTVEPIVKWHEEMLSGNGHTTRKARPTPPPQLNGTTPPCVAILFGRVGPYHFARLGASARAISTIAIEVSRTDDTYAWDVVTGTDGFKRVTLFESDGAKSCSGRKVAARVQRALDDCHPTVVALPGWFGMEALSALDWCVRTGTPAIVMSESTAWDDHRVPWKEWVKSRIVGLCSAGLVGGGPQRDYLTSLGMPLERIAVGYDAVDNRYFEENSNEIKGHSEEIRKTLGLPQRYFLASMRFVEKKNVPRLIQSYGIYRKKMEQFGKTHDLWDLVVVGDGQLKPELYRAISALGLSSCIHLPGFKQYNELPAYYALANAFIHPSTTEQWGLVVNEAMASGLPVLVSNKCGCAADLVREGHNGFTFDPYDIESLARLMARIATLPAEQLASMGNASHEIIASWGPERFAKGLSDAVKAAASAPARRASMLDRLLLKALLLQRTG
jgi:glycosyltransferase involved in cell wall biosynthesis